MARKKTTRKTPLAAFKAILAGRASAAEKASVITQLAPRLPEAALPIMDDYLPSADPIVQVAIMDAYFQMTDDDYHEDDLIAILAKAGRLKDKGEELFLAARLALGRVRGEPLDAFADVGIEIAAVRRPAVRRAGKKGIRRVAKVPPERETITVMIHGTWATNGTWWRKGGDFFEYVKTELGRADLYGERDQFRWTGDNWDSDRREGAHSLARWLQAHPAAEVNVFAHSHGANVAMLATREGVRLERLVMLSPPVRKDYFATWKNVGKAFNIQALFDPVVGLAWGGKSFRAEGLRPGIVKERVLAASGHSSTHDPKVWRAEKLGAFIGAPWPQRAST